MSIAGIHTRGQESKAFELFSEHDYTKAADLWQKEFKKEPSSETAYYIAESYRKLRLYDLATSWHQRSLSFENPHSFKGYVLTMVQSGKSTEASSYLDSATAARPDLSELYSIKQIVNRNLRSTSPRDSMWFLSDAEVDPLFRNTNLEHHTNKELLKDEDPSIIVSSVYPESLPSEKILRQHETEDLSSENFRFFGMQYKDKPIGIRVLVDNNDFSYYVYDDFFEEYDSHEHLTTVEYVEGSIIDGKVEDLNVRRLFKNERTIKYPALSIDGRTLVFASKELGGSYGQYDLYMMLNRSGKWSNPQNMGGIVNTKGDEIYPFIDGDNRLYFSSNGKIGYGDLDVFTIHLDSLNQSIPRLLSPPVNSAFDDYGYIVHSKSGLGIFNSNRNGNGDQNQFNFQKLIPDCKSSEAFAISRHFYPCNDSLFCIEVDASASRDPQGIQFEYIWEMGDGGQGKGEKFTYCYSEPKQYEVSLTVKLLTKNGAIMTNEYQMNVDLTEKIALKVEEVKSAGKQALTASCINCAPDAEVQFNWKQGNELDCGVIFEPGTVERPVECIMISSLGESTTFKQCRITIRP